MESTPKKLLDQVRDVLRLKHYSIRSENSYLNWIRRYILFHGKRHPGEMGAPEVEAFLTHLAVHEKVAASTQNQALSALRAQKPQRLPTALIKEEARTKIAGCEVTGKVPVTSVGEKDSFKKDSRRVPNTLRPYTPRQWAARPLGTPCTASNRKVGRGKRGRTPADAAP